MITGLAERLKECRMKNGLSRETVAKKIQISPSTLADYENGQRQPSLEVIFRLSGHYHCSTDYLLGKSEDEPQVILDVTELEEDELQVIKDMIQILKSKHPKK